MIYRSCSEKPAAQKTAAPATYACMYVVAGSPRYTRWSAWWGQCKL